MGEGNIFGIFGIKAFALVNKTTGIPYGRYRVIGGGEIAMTAKKVELKGGAQKFPWAVEFGFYDSEIKMTVREYPTFGFQLLNQGSAVIGSAEVNGNVSAITGIVGTSLIAGTTGISVAATAGAQANLQTGYYAGIAIGTGSIDLYYVGTQTDSYQDATLKVTATPLVLGGAGVTAIVAAFGLTFTSRAVGSSVFTAGDSFSFEVRKINTGNQQIAIGRAANSTPTNFIAYLLGEDQKTGDQFYAEVPNSVCSGLPLKLKEKEFSESEVVMSFNYDPVKDYAIKINKLQG